MSRLPRVAVLGAGAWGTALAVAAARAGCSAALWGRDPVAIAALAEHRVNAAHLPGIALPDGVEPHVDLRATLRGAEAVLAAVPAQALRTLLERIAPDLPCGVPLVVCAKGIERGTGRFLSEVVRAVCPNNPPAALSGPSFAADVGRGLPTAITVAADTLDGAARLGKLLGSPVFRLYHTDDLRGVEVGGAGKNVLALACGIARGRELGASAVAALTTRAFAELSRVGTALGGRAETLAGLSGLGDLILTCASGQSRNLAFGEALGRGVAERPECGGPTVEGVWTAPALVRLAGAHGIEVPVCAAVAAVLDGTMEVGRAIETLLARPFRPEL